MYRGKREAPRAKREGHGAFQPVEREESAAPAADPFEQQEEIPHPAMEDTFSPAVGDPFAGDDEAEDQQPEQGSALGRFFRSRKGKVITGVVCCLLAFGVGGAIALKSWIKPPDIPTPPVKPDTSQNDPSQGDDQPQEPTDDELYPDDGYMGEQPLVEGDRKEGMYTFLLVGTDMDDGNTDTIMVASYDTVNQKVAIMSIPRDTMINESWDLKKINSVYSRTGSSIESLSNRVKKLVGFKPDFYVKVDLKMFVELVDLVGGVEFDVPQDMSYSDPAQDLVIDLKEGVQVLDGEKAMELVRFRRYSEGDIKRVQVQQEFMKALIKRCLAFDNWGKVKAYIDLAMDNIQTDIEAGSVVWFASNVLGLNGRPMLNMDDVYTCTIPGDYWGSAWSRATKSEQSYVTIYPKQVVEVVNEYFNPYEQNVTTGMLDAMSILPNGDIASSTGTLKDTQHNAIMAVRRGEAYYDEDGKIVYGQKPTEPEVLQDQWGNYYILDESGNVVYTDEAGTPLTGTDPSVDPSQPADPNGTSDPGQTDPNQTDPGQPTDPGQSADPGQTDPGQTGDPTPPPEEEEETVNSEMPEWLRPVA